MFNEEWNSNPEQHPGYKWEKGNIDTNVRKTEKPIHSDNIDESIKDFFVSHSSEGELLKLVDYEVEFLIFEGNKGFIKFTLLPEKEKTTEISLQGEDLEEFINLIQKHGSGFDINNN